MVQTVILYNTDTDGNDPQLLYQGEMAVGVGPTYTRLWVGDGTENRLLLSDNPADGPIFGGGGGGGGSGYLPLTGGDLTGPLTISVPATTNGLTVGGRGVVYSQLAANSFSFFANGAVIIPFVNGIAGSGFLNVGGGNMTGALALSGDPINPMQAATKQYVDTMVPLAGGTMTGALMLSGSATGAQQAVPLQQLNAWVANYVPLAGGTMTGFLVLNADPTQPFQAATKQYVDSEIAGIVPGGGAEIGDTPPASPADGDLWWDTVSVKLYLWNGLEWVIVTNVPGEAGPAGPPGPLEMPPGVTDGSNATAGQVGEFLTASGADAGSMVTLNLTAGDWQVNIDGNFNVAIQVGVSNAYNMVLEIYLAGNPFAEIDASVLVDMSNSGTWIVPFSMTRRCNVTTASEVMLISSGAGGATLTTPVTITAWRMR